MKAERHKAKKKSNKQQQLMQNKSGEGLGGNESEA